mmetsp:Transcript_15479/g.40918  ORF Transcript_15479/g.40918 Transcript_15479/m.40918 type:complete len:253 (-) Transcript_15479:436-1194(-)
MEHLELLAVGGELGHAAADLGHFEAEVDEVDGHLEVGEVARHAGAVEVEPAQAVVAPATLGEERHVTDDAAHAGAEEEDGLEPVQVLEHGDVARHLGLRQVDDAQAEHDRERGDVAVEVGDTAHVDVALVLDGAQIRWEVELAGVGELHRVAPELPPPVGDHLHEARGQVAGDLAEVVEVELREAAREGVEALDLALDARVLKAEACQSGRARGKELEVARHCRIVREVHVGEIAGHQRQQHLDVEIPGVIT